MANTSHDRSDQGGLRDTATRLYERASSATEDFAGNPLGVLVGGLAVGAIAGALLPRSNREKELLAPLGKRLGETARLATQAAREAGMSHLEEAGLTKDAARVQVKGLLEDVTKALSAAGGAAAKAATNKGKAAASTPTGSPAEAPAV